MLVEPCVFWHILSAIDPPDGERAVARPATARGPRCLRAYAGGSGGGLLGLPGSMADGMPTATTHEAGGRRRPTGHPGAGAPPPEAP